ncbi:proline-rich protein 2-like [Alligator mississippiensis]|uniref:Proline-rich protein 2-like n=1 Tax=Alligator mississippiensis TaxID=8496 RepID=A0A151MNY9_ALLMI|nr:proline-rich protein 2-like [Alligator mississippiensis]
MSGPTWLPPKLAGGSPQPPRTVPTGPLETNGTPAPGAPNPRYPEVPRAGRIGYTMQGSTPDRGASIDDQIDSLTTMLADLESAAPSRWGGARQVQTLLDGGGVGQRKRLLDFGGGGKGRS